ncbi:hypothetical protein [Candidatus Nitrososphaera sp. FF02]|uniref:hypothetical protein n=1 Tax=Candidatus Nitrososphaera sp. FF02 TaxID=3398226 RepID=UPI0039E91016
MENCETCGQSCDSPITVLKGKRRLYFCSGDCEAMHEAQEHVIYVDPSSFVYSICS